jgi:hypothetical protein
MRSNGSASCQLAEVLGKACAITAANGLRFEVRALKRNIEINGLEHLVTVHEFALGATQREGRFHCWP